MTTSHDFCVCPTCGYDRAVRLHNLTDHTTTIFCDRCDDLRKIVPEEIKAWRDRLRQMMDAGINACAVAEVMEIVYPGLLEGMAAHYNKHRDGGECRIPTKSDTSGTEEL
jgi:hypothetical protein